MKQGERESFEEFVAGRYGALVRTAYLLTGHMPDAEDLVQSALTKAVPRWKRIDQPEAYLRRSIVNEHVSRWRRHRGRESLVPEPPDRPGGQADHDSELVLAEALRRLAPRQRAVIVLRYFCDLTEAQTAEALNITVGTVKSQSHDAIVRLRQALPDLTVGEPAPDRGGSPVPQG